MGTSGSEGGQQKPTSRKTGRALLSDPYTKIRGPQRGVYYDLYVILDIYSRYVVGWTIAARESAQIAEQLISAAVDRHGRPLSLHADRGTSMTSKTVTQLLVDLGVARSHSRPHVSNDCEYQGVAFGRV